MAIFAGLALASVLVISPSRIATLFGLVLAVPIGLRQLLASRQRPVPPAAVAKRVIGSSTSVAPSSPAACPALTISPGFATRAE